MQSILSHGYALAFLLGLWLAIGDQAAIAVRNAEGAKMGRIAWVALVLLPLLAMFVLFSWTAIGAMAWGIGLSGAAYLQANRYGPASDSFGC